MARISLKKGIEAFLSLNFSEPEKPYRRQRDARDDAMRVLGFTQAQEQLRNILAQCESATAAELSNVRVDGQLQPMKVGDRAYWVPPEYPVK